MKKSHSNLLKLLIFASTGLMLVSSPSHAELPLDFFTALTTGVSTGSDSGQWGAGTHALLQIIDDVSDNGNNADEKSVPENYPQNSAMTIKK